MNAVDDKPTGVDERIERLICRCLDGEAGAEERAELADIITRDPAARALFEEYERIDKLAVASLRRDLGVARPAIALRTYRGWRLGGAVAVLTAAAVVALSFLPNLWSPDGAISPDHRVAQDDRVQSDVIDPVGAPDVRSRTVSHPVSSIDYQDADFRPFRRLHDLRRDMIGIRPDKNRNVIYIFERDTHSARLIPVSGEI